jgi:antitoxin VapB
MAASAAALHSGKPEWEAAALLAGEGGARGGESIVVLVGSDERIYQYPHPTPTSKPFDRYVMLVLCLRRAGLVVALTRSVYIGELPRELQQTERVSAAHVDGAMIRGSHQGRTLGDMFGLAQRVYEH